MIIAVRFAAATMLLVVGANPVKKRSVTDFLDNPCGTDIDPTNTDNFNLATQLDGLKTKARDLGGPARRIKDMASIRIGRRINGSTLRHRAPAGCFQLDDYFPRFEVKLTIFTLKPLE